ncbi:MAG: MFS transporter [Asgard group archaeon]|nr:MFS transporter [Asgard group archaeon]
MNYLTLNLVRMIKGVTIKYPFWQEVVILLASTLTVMAGAAISPAIREMSLYFQSVPNYELVSKLILTVTALAIAISSPFVGFIIDKWGRKKLLILSTTLYAIFGTIGFYMRYFNLQPSVTLYLILTSRILFGFAVGGISVSCLTLIGDHYSGDKRNQVMGLQSTFMSFGGALYIVIGGALADIDWNFSFLVYFLSLLYLPTIFVFLTEPKIQVDLAVENSNNNENILLENSKKDKANKFPYKVAIISYSMVFILMIIFYFIATQFSFYLYELGETRQVIIGLAIAMSSIVSGIMGIFYQFIKRKLSHLVLFIIALVCIGTGFIVISIATSVLVVLIGTGIMGLGWGIFMPNIILWLLSYTPTKIRGRVNGILSAMIYLGQFLSPLISQPIIKAVGLSGLYLAGGITLFVMILVPLSLILFNGYKARKEALNTN